MRCRSHRLVFLSDRFVCRYCGWVWRVTRRSG